MHNWARSHEFEGTLREPASVDELQELIARSIAIRPAGTLHSFHDIADSPAGIVVSLAQLPRDITILPGDDRTAATVVVQGRITYGQLGPILDRAGYAVSNLASLPHISVAGVCATSTHGSGDTLQSLAGAVVGIEIVDASGRLLTFSRDASGDSFNGMVVALGALGVVTQLKLNIVPRFDVQQYIYENLPLNELWAHFDEVMGGAYSVSLFDDWQGRHINQVWCKAVRSGSGDAPHLDLTRLGETRAQGQRHPVHGSVAEKTLGVVDAANCTQQGGVPGPWYDRLPHFRLDHEPSCGEELQSEFFVARRNFAEAHGRIAELRDEIRDLIQISEIRTIAADRMWMSPAFERNSVGIHFTWRKNQPAVEALLWKIEERLRPLNARPHWGKLFMMKANDVSTLYPKLPDFKRLLAIADPKGKFRNPFLQQRVLGSGRI